MTPAEIPRAAEGSQVQWRKVKRQYGKDIEKTVLARGLRYNVEDRVLVNGDMAG